MLLRACLLILALSAASAAEPTLLERVREAATSVATVRLPFTQEKRLAMFPDPIVSEGAIEISRTLRAVRWEFTGRSLIILREGRLRRWDDAGREQTGDDPSLAAIGAQMRALLDGDFAALGELFTVSEAPDGAPALTMTPKRPDLARYLERIEMRFRDGLAVPESLTLVAPDDDVTLYRFGEPETGVELPGKRFAGP